MEFNEESCAMELLHMKLVDEGILNFKFQFQFIALRLIGSVAVISLCAPVASVIKLED